MSGSLFKSCWRRWTSELALPVLSGAVKTAETAVPDIPDENVPEENPVEDGAPADDPEPDLAVLCCVLAAAPATEAVEEVFPEELDEEEEPPPPKDPDEEDPPPLLLPLPPPVEDTVPPVQVADVDGVTVTVAAAAPDGGP